MQELRLAQRLFMVKEKEARGAYAQSSRMGGVRNNQLLQNG
jgi:hypothetical protein